MSEYLYNYHPVDPTTWVYLSSLLMVGLFFKFSRFWSVRNLDLVLLITLAPGLLFIHYGIKMEAEDAADAAVSSADAPRQGAEATAVEKDGGELESEVTKNHDVATADPLPAGTTMEADDSQDFGHSRGQETQRYGYLWLFCSGSLILARLLADPTMVRRPLLEPNLSAGGLAFIGCSLFMFLMANVISRPHDADLNSAGHVDDNQIDAEEAGSTDDLVRSHGPGYQRIRELSPTASKTFVILAHLVVVMGIVLVGYRHFDNIVMGIGAATMYLMLPYTSLMTNQVTHALPAALLVSAVLCYRRPLASGTLLGLAGGFIYYPLFLLPLWFSFYWPRGLVRFLIGVVVALVLLVCVLVIPSTDPIGDLRLMFGIMSPAVSGLRGIWDESLGGWNAYYRIPVLAAFVVLAISMTLWPAQKNLGTLLSCSAAIMVATQFWHGYGGGLYMGWYLPLLLMTIFRPNLEDRVALTVLGEGWLPHRFTSFPSGKAA